jgi:hypothetical protein
MSHIFIKSCKRLELLVACPGLLAGLETGDEVCATRFAQRVGRRTSPGAQPHLNGGCRAFLDVVALERVIKNVVARMRKARGNNRE